MPPQAETAPYVGSRPYERTEEDRRRFFGRDPEIDELVALVLSHNLLLVYAVSGAGKTSVLNAGVIPKLVEEGFEVLPRGRVGVSLPPETSLEGRTNPYVLNLLCSLSPEHDLASLRHRPLADHLRQLPPPRGSAGRVLVIDQAEELFTFMPRDWQHHQREFVLGLRDALRDAPDLRIVIVTREDYLARFDDLAPLLPGGLRMRLHLEPLSRESARQAVEGPLAGTQRTFDDGVANQLVTDLSKLKLAVGTDGVREEPGPYVEPVQLQIVCSALWSKLPDGVKIITGEHLQRFGDVEETLERFYEETIDACVRTTGYNKERLARWFGEELITPSDTRGQVFRGPTETKGLPNAVVAFLETRHLLHADERTSGRWYELTHDRLVRPIRAVNERWSYAFEAMKAQRRWRRTMWRWAGTGLGALVILGVLAAAIAIPRWQAQSRERALTAGRIDELRQELGPQCSEHRSECNDKRVQVFDAVADYYWRQDKIGELVALLKKSADLIPSDYGMPAPSAMSLGDNGSDQDVLRIEYNPAHPIDEWRMRFEWAQIAQELGRHQGIPVAPRIALVRAERVPPSQVRIVAQPATCGEPATRKTVVSSVHMPAVEGQALVSQSEIDKDEKLHRFFDRYRRSDGWKEYADLKINGPWWFVPAWTLPVWRVGRHAAVSREAVLAAVVASELISHSDLAMSCDALKAILKRASKAVPVSVDEAVAARTLEGLRLDFIELLRAQHQDLSYLPSLLDTLANHPGVTSAEAARLARAEHETGDGDKVLLHGPWHAPEASEHNNLVLGGLDDDLAEQLPDGKHLIRVELGPAIQPVMLDGGEMLREDQLQRQVELQRAVYRRYGILAPRPEVHPSYTEGLRFEVPPRDAGSANVQTISVSPEEAPDRFVQELDTLYRDLRSWWVSPEAIWSSMLGLPAKEQRWLSRHYSVTDLKRIARAVVAGYQGKDGIDTLRDLPWLLRSLTFWIHAYDPRSGNDLASALRDTQRARQRSSDEANPGLDSRVAPYIRQGLAALDAERTEQAESSFASAIQIDRSAAITAFLDMYPAMSSLARNRRKHLLAMRCRLPSVDASPGESDASIEYEVWDLLTDTGEAITPTERRHFEACLLWIVSEQGDRPHEVQRRISTLVTEAPADTWTAQEALFLARRWLLSNREQVTPPAAELSAVQGLLARGLTDLPYDTASSIWNNTLRKDLKVKPWRWTRELIGSVAGTLSNGWPSLKLDLAWWLAGLGDTETQRALALVDSIDPGQNADQRWDRARARAQFLADLGDYGEPEQRAQRLRTAAAALEELARDASDPYWAGIILDALVDVYLNMGDDSRARKAIQAGSVGSHRSNTLNEDAFRIELGDGNLQSASEIVAEMALRSPHDLQTLFTDSILATLTRRADFEHTARSFIFGNVEYFDHLVDYIRLMLFWALSEDGRAADAKQLLDQRMREIHVGTWPARLQQRDTMVWREMLIAVFAGQIPESRIFDPLRDDASFRASGLDQTELSLDGLRCEAYFYTALREHVTGDPATRDARFRAALQRVIDTHEYGYYEYRMARFLLSRFPS